MNDWGKENANKLRAETQYMAQRAATQLQHEKLRTEQGPRLWNEVREQIKAKCAELNREYGEEILTVMVGKNAELDVRFKAPSGKIHQLKATFEPSSADNALRWKTSGHRMNEDQTGGCELAINGDTVSFLMGAPCTAESIAEKMLESLLLG